jgi:hypothetical protein
MSTINRSTSKARKLRDKRTNAAKLTAIIKYIMGITAIAATLAGAEVASIPATVTTPTLEIIKHSVRMPTDTIRSEPDSIAVAPRIVILFK